jgi:hypothetical protein
VVKPERAGKQRPGGNTSEALGAQDVGQLHVQTGSSAVSSQRIFDWREENL